MIKRTVFQSLYYALVDYWRLGKRSRGMLINRRPVFILLTLFLSSTSASSSETALAELEKAFKEKDVSTATRILGGNVDRNIEMRGWPLIVVAANHGKPEIVRSIIATGADINATNNQGDTAISLAAYNNYPEVAELLASHAANLDKRSRDRSTPLIWAARKGHLEVVRILLRYGANPNLMDGGGNTALIAAAEKGHVQILTMLLDAGADINATNVNCLSALRESINNERHSVRLVLESRGASKNPACLGSGASNYVFGGFAVFLTALIVWELFHKQPGAGWRVAGYFSNIVVGVSLLAMEIPGILYVPIREVFNPINTIVLIALINVFILVAHNKKSVVKIALQLNELGLVALIIIPIASGATDMIGLVIFFSFALSIPALVNIFALRAQLKATPNNAIPI